MKYLNANSSVVLLTLSTSFRLSLSSQSERDNSSILCYMIVDRILTIYLYFTHCTIIYKSIPLFYKSIPLSIYPPTHPSTTHQSSIHSFLLQSQLIISMNEGRKYLVYFIVCYSNRMRLTTWFH